MANEDKYQSMSKNELIQFIHFLEQDFSKSRIENMKLHNKVKELEEKNVLNKQVI